MIPLVAEVLERQLRSLRWIYGVLCGCVGGVLLTTLLIRSPEEDWTTAGVPLRWPLFVLAGLAAVILGGVLPLTRRRLLDPRVVEAAGPAQLRAWGLPERVLQVGVGRQAIYLTRYTAGCVLSWGLCASVGLYGLVARMLGASGLLAGIFLAATVATMVLLVPRAALLRQRVEALGNIASPGAQVGAQHAAPLLDRH